MFKQRLLDTGEPNNLEVPAGATPTCFWLSKLLLTSVSQRPCMLTDFSPSCRAHPALFTVHRSMTLARSTFSYARCGHQLLQKPAQHSPALLESRGRGVQEPSRLAWPLGQPRRSGVFAKAQAAEQSSAAGRVSFKNKHKTVKRNISEKSLFTFTEFHETCWQTSHQLQQGARILPLIF